MNVEKMFGRNDWICFRDIVENETDLSLTRELAMEVFKKLPEEIKQIAEEKGMTDIVFKEEVYKHFT